MYPAVLIPGIILYIQHDGDTLGNIIVNKAVMSCMAIGVYIYNHIYIYIHKIKLSCTLVNDVCIYHIYFWLNVLSVYMSHVYM